MNSSRNSFEMVCCSRFIILQSVVTRYLFVQKVVNCCYLSKSYFLLKNWNLAFYSVQSMIFSLSVIFSISFISSIFIKCIYYLLEYMNNPNAKIFYISPKYYFVALFLINLIYLVVFYPGVATYDGIYQILEFYNLKTLSNHLPVLSTIIEGSIFHCGSIIKDNNFGLFGASI